MEVGEGERPGPCPRVRAGTGATGCSAWCCGGGDVLVCLLARVWCWRRGVGVW